MKLLDNWKWKDKDTITTRCYCNDMLITNKITINDKETIIEWHKTYGGMSVRETKVKTYNNDFILMLAEIIKEKKLITSKANKGGRKKCVFMIGTKKKKKKEKK